MVDPTGIVAPEASASKICPHWIRSPPIRVRVSCNEIIGRTISMRVTIGISRFGLHRCYYPNCSDERVGWHVACCRAPGTAVLHRAGRRAARLRDERARPGGGQGRTLDDPPRTGLGVAGLAPPGGIPEP